MARIDPAAYRIGAEAVWLADQADRCDEVRAPTLVLCGTVDRITPPALSQSLAKLIPGARYEPVEGAGHLSNLERPEAFNTLARRVHPRGRFAAMNIACVGGGPAGLYFAISMKLRDPSHRITLFERNPPGVTFGWGVVFSDQTVDNLMANDPVSAKIIADEFAHWDDIDVHIKGDTITSSGHGFIGIGRKRLLEILQDRARELGVELHFDSECDPADPQVARLRPGHRLGRQQFALPRCPAGSVRGRRRRPRQQVRVARHAEGVRRLHLRLRGDRARLDLGACLSLRRPIARPSSSNARRRPGPGSASTRWTRPRRSPCARKSSPNISTASRC